MVMSLKYRHKVFTIEMFSFLIKLDIKMTITALGLLTSGELHISIERERETPDELEMNFLVTSFFVDITIIVGVPIAIV